MNVMEHLIPCFTDSVRIDSPDWYLIMEREESSSVCVRLSDLDRLREAEGLPKSFRLFVLIDTHFGKVKPPKSTWWAITPYGIYRMESSENVPEGFKPIESTKSGTFCTECHMSVWPCEKCLVTKKYLCERQSTS